MCPNCGSKEFEYLGSSIFICLGCKILYFKDDNGDFQFRKGVKVK